jgi:tRNA threonylcarbamoyladenosine biosynthesis protein TsaB
MSDPFNLLLLETSAQVCSVSVVNESKQYHVQSDTVQNHAEVLMRLIQTCTDQAGIQLSDLSAVVLSDGPGSYTGLRIGSSTAKGLCFALNIPLIAISTLQSLALRARAQSDKSVIWPMIDARRMEVYHAIYGRSMDVLQSVTNGIIDEAGFVPEWLEKSNCIICGDGGKKASSYLGIEFLDIQPSAEHLASLAIEAWRQGQFVDLASYEPFYLKSANITVAK